MEYGNLDEIIDRAIPRIFDFNFPIFDESHRNDLCKGIILEYLYDEIAYDTPGQFKIRLRSLLNQIMPYYNGLYETEAIKYDPLHDVNYTRTYKHDLKSDGTTDSTSNTTSQNQHTNTYGHTSEDNSKNVNKYSDTPQGTLRRLEDGTYMSSGSIDENASKTQNKGSQSNISGGRSNTTDNTKNNVTEHSDDVETVIGKRGMTSNSQMILDKRKTLLNIDKMIIDECQVCFLALWY